MAHLCTNGKSVQVVITRENLVGPGPTRPPPDPLFVLQSLSFNFVLLSLYLFNMQFHYSMLRPEQIKYLFHGSSRSAFITLGKILLNDGCVLACMAGQKLVSIITTVPCEQLNR